MIDDCEKDKALIGFKGDESPIRKRGLKVFNLVKDFRTFLNIRTLRKLEGGVRKFRGFRVFVCWAPKICRLKLQTP